MIIVMVAFAEEVESLAWLGVLLVTPSGTLVSAIEATLSATPNSTRAVSATARGMKATSLITPTPLSRIIPQASSDTIPRRANRHFQAASPDSPYSLRTRWQNLTSHGELGKLAAWYGNL